MDDETVNAYKKVYDRLVNCTREWFYGFQKDRQTAVLGVSGGKDSSLCACVLADAIGAENVYGVIMPYGKTMGEMSIEPGESVHVEALNDYEAARIVVSTLGLNRVEIDIEKPVDSILRQVAKEGLTKTEQASINVKPRIRMAALYAVAQSVGGFVVNTSNIAELYVGYGTLWGDIVGDFGPIRDLYPQEVVQLGIACGKIDKELFLRPPADGLSGKTDEENLGVTYDQIRSFMEGEMPINNDMETYHRILMLNHASAFKAKAVNVPHPTRKDLFHK